MANHLAIYLNDHLAGSVVALGLLKHLEKAHAGTPLERVLTTLRADILDDRAELEAMMAKLHIAVSPPRKAMAWLAEKFAELKLRLDDASGGSLHLLEALDALATGIDGKQALWRALSAAAVPGLQEIDYARLEGRAVEQRGRIETVRLQAARSALKTDVAQS